MSTRLAVSDAIQVVRSRQKRGNFRTVRYSGKRACRSELEKASPRPMKNQESDQDPGSDPDWEPEKNRESETKVHKSDSIAHDPSSYVPSYVSSRFRLSESKSPSVSSQETVQKKRTEEHAKTKKSEMNESVVSTEASNAICVGNLMSRLEGPLGIEDAAAFMTRHSLSARPTIGINTESKAGDTKKRVIEPITSADQNKEENTSRKRKKRCRPNNTGPTEQAAVAPVSLPDCPLFQLYSISIDDLQGRPSADVILPTGGAVPWLDISQEEREILGLPTTSEVDWDWEWQQNEKLEEATCMEGGLFDENGLVGELKNCQSLGSWLL